MSKVEITTAGIKKTLRNYDYIRSIPEYIWNGFDAGATTVSINIIRNDLGAVTDIEIVDNGTGIDYENLPFKFGPFYDSEKIRNLEEKRTTSTIHGKKGIGRLTFFSFAADAIWSTSYEVGKKRYTYTIRATGSTLNEYTASNPIATKELTGTIVNLRNIFIDIDTDTLKNEIAIDFGWYLELNQLPKKAIIVNGQPLDYSDVIVEKDTLQLTIDGNFFDLRYVQWTESLGKEFSRFYLVKTDGKEVYKNTTTLNRKSDNFYHSVYVYSDFFNDFYPINGDALGHNLNSTVYRQLVERIECFLIDKRREHIRKYCDALIKTYEAEGIFPQKVNQWDLLRQKELKNLIKELYQVEPKIFMRLNIQQKKIFVRLLDLIIDSEERDDLFEMLQQIVDLNELERRELASILKTNELSSVVQTIKVINDRMKIIAYFKDTLFKEGLHVIEPKHIQGIIERNLWIIGEKYNLVTSAEPKFEEALRRFLSILQKDIDEIYIDHPNKEKEMDIFMIRQDKRANTMCNVVVELKNPKVNIGKKQLDQVQEYMDVIIKQPEFNASNMKWEFYLIGNDFTKDSYIERQFENAKNHGELNLAFKVNNYSIYVKKWSELLTDFELRHDFMISKLETKRNLLINQDLDANKILEEVRKIS